MSVRWFNPSRLLGAVACLCLLGITCSAGFAEDLGTLNVHIYANCLANGGYRVGYIGADQSVWIYAHRITNEDSSGNLEWTLIGSVQVHGNPPEELPSVQWRGRVGRYQIQIVQSSGKAFSPFAVDLTHATTAELVGGQTTSVRFPGGCYYGMAWSTEDLTNFAASSEAINRADDYVIAGEMVARKKKECEEIAVPLQLANGSLGLNGPVRSTIFIRGPWAGGRYPSELANRDYDAAEIRLMVKGLQYLCGQYLVQFFRPRNEEERSLVADGKSTLENEVKMIGALYTIADQLEAAARQNH